MHDGHIHVGNPSEDERNLYLRKTVDRAGNLYRKRKLAKKTLRVDPESMNKYLKRAYLQYSTLRHKRGRGEPYMVKCGFLNLLRDCQLLDNKTTLLDLATFVDKELDRLESEQKQGSNNSASSSNDGNETSSSSTQYNTRPLTLEDVDHLLNKTAALKYPDLEEQEAVVKLYEIHVMPFIKQSNGADKILVQLFTDQVLDVVKKHSKVLKLVYSHYATLSLVSFHHSNWKAVRRANRALTLDEYVTFMLNFEVAPTLFNHQDIEELFDKSNQNKQFNEDPLVWMNFSQFIECLLRCGIRVVDSLESKISRKSATITELNSFKKFISHLPTAESKMHFTDVLAQRRKAAHDKIVMTAQNSQINLENKAAATEGIVSNAGDSGPASPSNTQNTLNAGGLQGPVDSNAMKTVWAEESEMDEESRIEHALRKKQEALNVTLNTLKDYIQEDLGEAAAAPEDSIKVSLKADLDLDDFEERLRRATWKSPQEEMKGWKTGAWKGKINA